MSWDEWVGNRLGVLICLALVALVALAIVAAVYDERAWNRYAAEHHCVAIGKKQPSNGLSFGDGKVVFIPDQTIYRCDGGEEIIR